jgi:hypothetical protein
MNLLPSLLAIALSWPVPTPPAGYERESDEAYRERVTVIVRAIAAVTDDPYEAAALLVLSRDESTFDPWIHAGLAHPDPRKHQDHGRARCVLQIHRSRLVPEWAELAGTDFDSTVRCMKAGLRLLRGAAGYCKASLHTRPGVTRALSLYATGRSCLPITLAKERSERWSLVVDEINRRQRPARHRPRRPRSTATTAMMGALGRLPTLVPPPDVECATSTTPATTR